MSLFLGVCNALKAMHQYRVKKDASGAEGQRKAKRVRATAARADEEAATGAADADRKRKGRSREANGVDTEQEPLMEGEITMAQEGIADGEARAYAHRDIKPGS